jgi:hypothetical protein
MPEKILHWGIAMLAIMAENSPRWTMENPAR